MLIIYYITPQKNFPVLKEKPLFLFCHSRESLPTGQAGGKPGLFSSFFVRLWIPGQARNDNAVFYIFLHKKPPNKGDFLS